MNLVKGVWSSPDRTSLYVFVIFLFACAVGGGSARSDVVSLLFLRPVALIAVTAFVALPGRWRVEELKVLSLLLAAFGLSIAVQLVPVPPRLWDAMPGHSAIASGLANVGLLPAWRPISLDPDATWNSLFALLPATAVLIWFARAPNEDRDKIAAILLSFVGVSVVLGMVQMATNSDHLYLYDVSHFGSAVGLFANRNHQATMMVIAIPLLMVWLLEARGVIHRFRWRAIVTLGAVMVLIPMLAITGSRAGIMLATVGLAIAAAVGLLSGGSTVISPRGGLVAVGGLALAVGSGLVVVLSGRATAIARILSGTSLQGEQRFENAPIVLSIIRKFFPFGTGFGSFDPAFRIFEPDSSLHLQFFNHAHNDFLELAMTGGVLAICCATAFCIWWWRRCFAVFRGGKMSSVRRARSQAGAGIILIILLASAVDYPLRTPLISVFFAVACCWLCARQPNPATRSDDQSSLRDGGGPLVAKR